jgi:UrcA family protein
MRNGTRFTTLFPACLMLGACALLTQTGNAAVADATDGARSVTIRYADLDMSSTDGVHTLYERIDDAAHLVCPEGRRLEEQRQALACYQQALQGAVGQVNNPLLTAVYAQQHGGTRRALLTD